MSKQTKSIPVRHETAEASFSPDVNDPNLITLTWTTGFKGLRSDAAGKYFEELEVSDAACDLSRLKAKAPLLANHDMTGLGSVIGVVERAWIEGGLGKATVRLSKRTDVTGIAGDIRDGILRNVSVGYAITQMTDVSRKGDAVPTLLATKWQPYEISIVPVGFDPKAQTQRSQPKEELMTEVEILTRTKETEVADKDTEVLPVVEAASVAAPIEGERAGTTAAVVVADKDPDSDTTDVKPAAKRTKRKGKGKDAAGAGNTADEDPDDETDDDSSNIEDGDSEDPKAKKGRSVSVVGATVREIASAVSAAGLPAEFALDLAARGLQMTEVTKAIFAEAETKQVKTGGADRNKETQMTVNKRSLVEAALSHRMSSKNALPAEALEFKGQGFLRAFEAILPREIGEATPSYAARVMQTTDLPQLLANVANKQLRISYEELQPTYTQWAATGTTPDFKTLKLVNISVFPAMQAVAEGANYPTSANISDTAESMTLASYGQVLSFTRQMLINDDLSALSNFASRAASAAMRNVEQIAYGILASNGTMADTHPLFDATNHHNYVAAGSGAAPSIATLTAAKVAMARQTDPSGALLDLKPKFIIVPPELETATKQLINSTIVPNTVNQANPFAGTLQVVVSARLSGTAWYLAADNAIIDTVKVFFLEGQEAPAITTRMHFENGATDIKVTHDVGAVAMDFRGLYCNAGA